MQSIPRLLTTSFWRLLYPPRCGCCGTPISAGSRGRICTSCFNQVEFIRSPVCVRCGKGLSPGLGAEDRYCGSCLKNPPVFDSARSFFIYQGPVRTLLHRLKYSSDAGSASTLGSLIGCAGTPAFNRDFEVIVPVPLFRSRLSKRGLNQALVLANTIFPEQADKIDPTMLIRVKNTIAQTQLSRRERKKNLRDAFAISPASTLSGRKICLVDDIFTTGTTVTECSRILKKNGADSVDILTCARA